MKKKLCKPKSPPPPSPPQIDGGGTPPSRKTKRAERVLPPEVVEEILARLPVKSLLIFRCVSKSWRCSIDSRFFVNKRLRSSAKWKVISTDTALDDDPNKHLMKDSSLVGSCNGLLCILKQKSFFLWNPTTRISIELPKLDFQIPITKYGLGWDEGSDVYKVFVVVSEKDQKIGKVYSSLTNSWKTVESGYVYVNNPEGFFSCGNIHWLTKSGLRIESFDLKSEVFRMTEQAFKPQTYMWLMQTVDGCLGVVCDNNKTRFDAWVMKKYWVKESWVKQHSAPIPLEYKDNYNYTYSLEDTGGVQFFPSENVGKGVQYHYVESLVSPVYTSRQEIEQEQAIPIAKDQPKRQIKRKPVSLNTKKRCQNKRKATVVEVSKECEQIAPKRQAKRRAAGEVSKEVVTRRQCKRITAGLEGGKVVVSRRKSKRIAARVEASKEVVPRSQSKRIAARAEVSNEVVPKRRSERRAVGYGVKETNKNQENIVQEQVHTSIAEGRPKRQNKRKEMEKEQAHPSVAEGRPKRQNRRMPARYILE